MQYKIYRDGMEFLSDNPGATYFSAVISQFKKLDTKNYAFKFADGEDVLLILKVSDKMLLQGNVRLAGYAADTLADYHLQIGPVNGEKGLVDDFLRAYNARLGGSMRQALFAGGCFWCMAKPYYEYEGINKVFSGYAGGDIINPAYEEVKTGETGHKETVMLEYDSRIITFEQLLDIYFDTIDPFDDGGQFIDRGDNYTCAIFTDDKEELSLIARYIAKIERESKRKVQVKVPGDEVFYKAEEYHQDYALKNPEEMEEELKKSGRLN